MRLRSLVISALLATVAIFVAPAAASAGPSDAGQRVLPGDFRIAAWAHLQNANSGLCLVSRAGSGERPALQTTCDFTVGQYWADQYWEIRGAGDGGWSIHNLALGLCLVGRGGESTVVATTCDWKVGQSWADQHWILWSTSVGYRFENVATGLCLVTRGSGESRAVVSTCDYKVGQYWADQHWYY